MAKKCSTKHSTLLHVGIMGGVVAALYCATPVLVIFLDVMGLGWRTGYLTYVVLSAFAVFLELSVYAVWRTTRQQEELHEYVV